ncbi:ParB family protein [Salmonella enterica]
MNNDQGTLVSVSLEQLRAFDLNPRITRNPNYDEIKESIRHRGLEHPPQITQRPGDLFYIIANGGNTRLAILNELWLETHDKKYWNITCLFRKWTAESLEQGNLNCLLGHLVENEMRGDLTFIERALAVYKAIDLYQNINSKSYQKDYIDMLSLSGYSVSPTLLSVMSAAIKLLLPHIPDLLYCGLSRKNIEKLLALRSGSEKFWDKFCQEHSSGTEKPLPLFDDIFAVALASFNGPAAGFSLEHIQDELTGLISQTLNIDYNTVALVTDARAQKRTSILGGDPVPELPDISEQRRVDLKYQKSPDFSQQKENDRSDSGEPDGTRLDLQTRDGSEYHDEGDNNTPVQPAAEHRPLPGTSREISATETSTTEDSFQLSPSLPDTPESLASFIDQAAWELAGNAGLEFLVSPTDTGIFDIAPPAEELSNEGKIYWQLLAFLAGKLPGSTIIWRQMIVGTPDAPAGFNDETLLKIFQLIRYIRRLYEKQHQGDNT